MNPGGNPPIQAMMAGNQPANAVMFSGHKRARPGEVVHHGTLQQGVPMTMVHQPVAVQMKRRKTVLQRPAPTTPVFNLWSPYVQPQPIPLTIEQQRAYVVEHRKISINQLKTHLVSAEAELQHLQKGGHYVNFRVSSTPKLSVPAPAPKPKKKPRQRKKKEKKEKKDKKEKKEKKAEVILTPKPAAPPLPKPAAPPAPKPKPKPKPTPAVIKKEPVELKVPKTVNPPVKAPVPAAPPVPSAATAQQKTLLKELDELQKKKKRLTAMIRDFQKTGGKRMKKSAEPPRNKVHWDYLLDEMGWMSTDFNNERKWKSRLAKKIMRAVVSYHEKQHALPEREAKQELARRKKGAAIVARLIKKFWSNIGKLVDFKRSETLNQKKNVDLNRQLELLVDHTQSLTKMVAKDLVVGTPNDEEFKVREKDTQRDREDREALAQMEAEEEATKEDHQKEIIALEEDNKLSLEELKEKYKYSESTKEAEPVEMEEEEEEDEEEEEKKALLDASAKASAHIPSGFDLGTMQVKTKLPSLLRHGTLREYQHIGLDWLVTMGENKLNGILADEMGLGKTIQTIAMLGHLACEKGIWGQHLVVVPTAVLVNWEIEFKRWLPGFKILCYHGTQKERKIKRKGWSNPNTFHVCITSYQLILQDSVNFKRKRWHYLILDEAQNIKNFRTKRWQVLLTFRTERRLLLTGTPLQNNVMELWSLMHFLMPHVFQSQKEFQDWFSDPVKNMVEGKERMNKGIISNLHKVLRPFILRRLKKDVAKQMPKKYEHTVYCRLAKRQRILYEEFMANSATRKTLDSNNFLGLMNVLMQLRKVCNHPDIFAGRPIISPFDQGEAISFRVPSAIPFALTRHPLEEVGLSSLGLQAPVVGMPSTSTPEVLRLQASRDQLNLLLPIDMEDEAPTFSNGLLKPRSAKGVFNKFWMQSASRDAQARDDRLNHRLYVNSLRCASVGGMISADAVTAVQLDSLVYQAHVISRDPKRALEVSDAVRDMIKLPARRACEFSKVIENYICVIPKARAPAIKMVCYNPKSAMIRRLDDRMKRQEALISPKLDIFYPAFARMKIHFPDKRLIQWDCGKLQMLSQLLKKLKAGGHRVLLFTQMTRMLDILEHFLNIYGYTYLRLDGATKPEQRQRLMERFNNSDKIFCFILSTRSGGVGVNLTGADTVIFYDTDWNPAMDLQAQDRCHRIGQTRDVHIYRLVTLGTIEPSILKKSNQKRQMNNMVIGDGQFNTDFFSKMDPRELLGLKKDEKTEERSAEEVQRAMACVEDETDQIAARRLNKETMAQAAEFSDGPGGKGRIPLKPHSFEQALSAVQRYALRFAEANGASASLKTPANGQHVRLLDAQDSQSKNDSAGNIEKDLFYPSTKGVKGYRAQVAHVEKLGFIYDSKIFTPLQFPSQKNYMDEELPMEELGLFTTEESIKKMQPSTRDRKNQGITKSFLRDSKLKRRMHDMDTPSLTVRVPLSMLRKYKKRVHRRISDSQHYHESAYGGLDRSKENRPLPRKAYHKIKKVRRMFTEGLFPPRVIRTIGMKNRSSKDESTSSDHIPWTQDEEALVERAFSNFGPNWTMIANILNNNPRVGGRLRTPSSCEYHHNLILIRGMKTDEELRKESQKRKKKEVPRKKVRESKDSKTRSHKAEFVMATPKQPCGNLYQLIDKSMKSINAQRRLSLENEDSTNKSIVKNAHQSHKKAITDSHTRLGLPQLAIGKTLMPHQIIQLRNRCMNQEKQAGGRIGPSVHQSSRISQFSGKSHGKSTKTQNSAQQRKQQLAVAQQRRISMQSPHENSSTAIPSSNGKPGVVNHPTQMRQQGYNPLLVPQGQTVQNLASYPTQHIQGRGVSGAQTQIKPTTVISNHKPIQNHIQRPVAQVASNPSAQQLQIPQLLQGRAVGSSSLTAQQLEITQQIAQMKQPMQNPGGALSGHAMPNAQFLKYVLHSVPSLKQEVVKILQRSDWTEPQKIDRIATLFRDTSAKQGKNVVAVKGEK